MLRQSRAALACALVLALICGGGAMACSPRKATTKPPAAAAADTTGAAALAETASSDDPSPESDETCDGALDCTFFGIGAVLAAPFWLLSVVLGMAF
jgi:hypothetical protein